VARARVGWLEVAARLAARLSAAAGVPGAARALELDTDVAAFVLGAAL